MGNKNSKNYSDIQQSHHSCSNTCFTKINKYKSIKQIPSIYGSDQWIYTKKHTQSLIDVLSSNAYAVNINITFYVSIIASYFNFEDTLINSYHAYTHGAINKQSIKLCSKWLQKYIPINNLSIAVLGSQSGKSSLIQRFDTDTFQPQNYFDPDMEATKTINIDNNTIHLDITEVHQNEEFMHSVNLTNFDILVLMFSIDDKRPFKQYYGCLYWLDEFVIQLENEDRSYTYVSKKNVSEKGAILVAGKCDLLYGNNAKLDKDKKDLMQSNYEKGMKLSKILNIPFIETSAKDNVNVHLLFQRIVYEYWMQTETQNINWNENVRHSMLE
eukprot:223495_1